MSRRLRTLLWRTRWLVVAVCLAVAVWVVLGQLRPVPPPTVPVVVAARDLPAGTTVAETDVRVERLPAAARTGVTVADVIGSRLTIGVPEGLPVVPTMLLGPGLPEAAPPGWVVTPVVLADPVLADLLRVGDRLDLYLAAADTGGRTEEARLVTAGALVLARHEAEAGTSSWLGGGAAATVETVVVAVRPGDAGALTGASGFGPFRAVLSGAAGTSDLPPAATDDGVSSEPP